MKATFQKTVDILVKAYLNDTLEHGKCAACAVGNIVASAIGTKAKPLTDGRGFDCYRFANGRRTLWDKVFVTSRGGQALNPEMYFGEAKEVIDATGYTWQQLARIEYAFESAPASDPSVKTLWGPTGDGLDDEWMFNGLMAVVDVLADIHSIDLEQKESAKALFVKA